MKKLRTNAMMLVAAVTLAGCQTYADRPWYDPFNMQVDMKPRDDKRVQVVPSETAFALQFENAGATISAAEHRAATAFLQRRALADTDDVFVDFGVFVDSSSVANQRRRHIADLAAAAGIDPGRVRVRSNIAGIAENEVNLTIRHYLVTLPGCPDFTSRAGRTFDNRPHSNWGCATASNFGRMVAEPRDILEGRGETLADGEAIVLGIQRFRAGITRELDVDDSNTANSHGVKGSSGGGGGGNQ